MSTVNASGNELAKEASVYLRQHANNPVHWKAWTDATWQLARESDKLVLVSIGYAACHWCHVMEHESFEDAAIADIMNQHFVCIKVDREERPDVDQFYMDAVQLMSGHGGWPLNVFCLPDGRPIYGGTYFRPTQWTQLLRSLHQVYSNERQRVLSAADDSMRVLSQTLIPTLERTADRAANNLSLEQLIASLQPWIRRFDPVYGGETSAPKFPMPCSLLFLVQLAECISNYVPASEGLAELGVELHKHVETTIEAMLKGGIWDQLGGGFARYSTDREWKLPHFEKMLYDSAQMVSLSAQCYRNKPSAMHEKIMRESIAFLERDLRSASGAYYSALDADSEGEEGRYYTWSATELSEALGNEAELFRYAFGCTEHEELEDGRYVLVRRRSVTEISEKFACDTDTVQERLKKSASLLFRQRLDRQPPATDTKLLISWNALAVSALAQASIALNDRFYQRRAEEIVDLLLTHGFNAQGDLAHCLPLEAYTEQSPIAGFSDDYVLLATACIDVYELSGNTKYLDRAIDLCAQILDKFARTDSALLNYAEQQTTNDLLVHTRPETHDTVIPSSNALAAQLFLQCGILSAGADLIDRAAYMLRTMSSLVLQSPQHHSAWLSGILQWHLGWQVVRYAAETAPEEIRSLQTKPPLFVRFIEEQDAPFGAQTIEICDAHSCQTSAASQAQLGAHISRRRKGLQLQSSLL